MNISRLNWDTVNHLQHFQFGFSMDFVQILPTVILLWIYKFIFIASPVKRRTDGQN